eukprot:TRINITY_DN9350_c0_g1_i1.p1 TRINITY_DN9350_c0_g1~~TRINITY_DN9350_c0_g1_i1.p1  ORF type:complete len:431 (-),score=53.00 TRINITY_DN9350_c0_g1_i1:149-1315(-)
MNPSDLLSPFDTLSDAATLSGLLSALLCVVVFRSVFCCELPSVVCQRSAQNNKILANLPTLRSYYRYPVWGRSGHLQTLYMSLLRRWAPEVNYRRERLTADSDGGLIILDILDPPDAKKATATVLVIPGICNSSQSCYVREFVQAGVQQHGLRMAVYNPRGTYEITTPRLFRFGDTSDLHVCVRKLKAERPDEKIIIVGFSLGGNKALRYVGEHPEAPKLIAGVVSCCQGYCASHGTKYLQRCRPFYDSGLTRKLKNMVIRHAERFEGMIDMAQLHKANSVESFDRSFTCAVSHYETPEDYYKSESCIGSIPKIKVPALLFNALNDPLVDPAFLPMNAPLENPNLMFITTRFGGHMGFCEGYFLPELGASLHWHERLFLDFCAAVACG